MKNKKLRPDLSLGILGGGQLARMLALAAAPLGINTHILSQTPDDPAAHVTKFWKRGNPNKSKILDSFFKELSISTFESEFFDAQTLSQSARSQTCQVFPKPQLMAKLQDRLPQKNLLLENKLPTSPFVEVNDPSELVSVFEKLGPYVLKTRRNGYDGYGTFMAKTPKQALQLSKTLKPAPDGWIAEKFISFQRELAVIAVRSRNDDVVLLPFVETFQEDSRCLWVKGPIETKHTKAIASRLKKFLRKIDYVGAMGIEFFETPEGLVINELAPRVHNSGHYSQNALDQCQFSYHIKAVLGLSLTPPQTLSKGFAMVNLLGKPYKNMSWEHNSLNGAHLHWYGKKESRAGRKMGHINCLAETPDKALKKALNLRKRFYI